MQTIICAGREIAEAYDRYIRNGLGGMDRHDRVLLQSRFVTDPRMSSVMASQGVSVGSGGGYVVPDETMHSIVEALHPFDSVRRVATIVPTSTGADFPIPNDADTSVEGEIITENSESNDGDIPFGQVVLRSFLYSSKIVKVSRQLLQDFQGDMPSYVGRKLWMRIGRAQNAHFTTGDGISKPQGIASVSSMGVTTVGADSIIYDELVDLIHSVDPAYQPTACWMMNFATLGLIQKLTDLDGHPLWSSLANGAPGQILGRPYILNEDMPDAATGLKSVLYGDFSNYHIRDAGNLIILRLDERYADKLQVGFVGFIRSDGDLIDAGTHPVKHLIHA